MPNTPTSSGAPSVFQWRALVSVLVTLSFLVLAVSGLVLFVSPPGRIANWTNWAILGLSKSDWAGLHIWFSTIFLGASILHLVLNWRPLMSYLKGRATRRFAWRREWIVGVAVFAAVLGGTRAGVVPFSTLLAWNEELKESWDQPAARAPIPHAELLTLAQLAAQAGVEAPVATARLQARGVTDFTEGSLVKDIAAVADMPAQRIYEIIRAESAATGTTNPPATAHVPGAGAAGGGVGWKTLAQFCSDEGIAVEAALARLKASGIAAREEQTVREIAREAGNRKPYELLEVIRGAPAAP